MSKVQCEHILIRNSIRCPYPVYEGDSYCVYHGDGQKTDYDTFEGMKREFMKLKELDKECRKQPIKVKCEFSATPSFINRFLYYISFGYIIPQGYVHYDREDAIANEVSKLIYIFAENVCDDYDNLLFRDHYSKRNNDAYLIRSNNFFALCHEYITDAEIMTSYAFMFQYILVLSDIIGYDIPAYEFIADLYNQVLFAQVK